MGLELVGAVAIFSCMHSDPRTQVQLTCSPSSLWRVCPISPPPPSTLHEEEADPLPHLQEETFIPDLDASQ